MRQRSGQTGSVTKSQGETARPLLVSAFTAQIVIDQIKPSSIRICEPDRQVRLAIEPRFRPLHVPVAWMRLGDALHGPVCEKMI